jgi:hypothetical protein
MKYRIFYIFLLIGLITSCTIIPKQVHSNQPGFDGSSQNAGFIGYTNGFGIITENKRAEYNSLIQKYNSKLLVSLEKDSGLSDGPIINNKKTYLIDKEHLLYFAELYNYYLNGEELDK